MIKQSSTRRPRTKGPEEEAQPIPETAPVAAPKGSTRMPPLAVGLVIVILAAAAFLFLKNGVTKPTDVQAPAPAPTAGSNQQPTPTASQEDIQALIAKVAAHITVKQDEAPTVATIQNADMLRAQNPVFYKDAQVGDRLLIWSDKAVLYSPASDKVLSVLPITLPPNAGTATSTSAVSSTGTAMTYEGSIEVRNGSGIAGRGKSTAAKLKAAGLTVLPASDAKSTTPYQKSIIVASDKASAATVQELQELTGAAVTVAPAVEGALKGDILLIVGIDAK